MKKFRHSLVATVAAAGLLLTGCSASEGGSQDTSDSAKSSTETISIEDNHGAVDVPVEPEKVAITDNTAMRTLAEWDVDAVAMPLQLAPANVADKYNADSVKADLGTHREPNLEAIVAAEPEVVVNGNRFEQHYDAVKKLVPDAAMVELSPRDDKNLDEELIRQTEALGKIFGKEDEADKLIEDFNKALERAKKAYNKDKKVMAVNVSGGDIGYVAPGMGVVYGKLFDLIGMEPALEVENASDDHQGDDISVEAIAKANPDILLVVDRDAAVDPDNPEYKPAKNIIEDNEAMKSIPANKNGNVVYADPNMYKDGGIISYTDLLNEMAETFEAAK